MEADQSSRWVAVLEKLLDEVNVGHDHAPAAVTLASELVHRLSVPRVSRWLVPCQYCSERTLQ